MADITMIGLVVVMFGFLLWFAYALLCIGYILFWNLYMLARRAIDAHRGTDSGRPFKSISIDQALIGCFVLYMLVVSIPSIFPGEKLYKDKNTGVMANTHQVQLGLEAYAISHDGRYPESLRELFPKYLPGYPRTPWNTQQDPSADIPASFEPANDVPKWRLLGTGAAENPRLPTHFGAIGYTRLGPNGRSYRLAGTGRKGNKAVIVTFRNLAAPESPTPPPTPPREEISATAISGQVPDPASKR